MTIDGNLLKKGDTFYGAIPTYSCRFIDGWKVKKVTVLKESLHYVWLCWDKESEKYPQKIKLRNSKK